ncbi:MAG: methyltransferase domain-containing protein [Pseudomonadota bacterium]
MVSTCAQTSPRGFKIIYQQEDMSCMSFPDDCFDLVLIINSILSANDLLNRRMVKDCHRVLQTGGELHGFFPTIFMPLEISTLCPSRLDWQTDGTIDLYKNTFYEHGQKMLQMFYSPLRLRHIFKEVGFKLKNFQVYFFDSDYFQKETERIYGILADSEVFIWEILATLEK